jgi:serine/threonine-protein kinase
MARPYNNAAMKIRAGRKLDKYRIEKKLAEGGFADVFRAYDTVEGIRVALKVPHAPLITPEILRQFRKEVRVNARLDHPNILPIKYAGYLEGLFVMVYPLGIESLDDRLRRRISTRKALLWAGQILDAVAHAHGRKIFHGDLKPDNLILFPGDRLRLSDFGLARVMGRTLSASGSGTVGYMAPEQAMGKPSLRSDVFSAGLILYRMLSGKLPEWPYDWPLTGCDRLRGRVPREGIEFLRRALQVDHRRRFADCAKMKKGFDRIRWNSTAAVRRKRRTRKLEEKPLWRERRHREFQARFRKALDTRFSCTRCCGPVSEAMRYCPWCSAEIEARRFETRFPARCPRCGGGRKLDWRYCPWCYGSGFRDVASRSYTDLRYEARCSHSDCPDKRLMSFMRYCPWCRRKVARPWKVPGSRERCPACEWGVLKSWWSFCPWCGRTLGDPAVGGKGGRSR